MVWKRMSEMDEKLQFVGEWLAGGESVAALCARYGISRQTGYALKRRYDLEGASALCPRSRAPHHHGRSTAEALVLRIVALRNAKPHWGPKKLLTKLREQYPDQAWPAHGTISQILRREGLAKPRSGRQRRQAVDQPFGPVEAANAVWCIDFKGWFETLDALRCDPFTVTDAFSRYVLGIQIMSPTIVPVQEYMDEMFQEYGVPDAIRSDNGPPFASMGAGGLSRLSVRWAKMGITLERIRPGTPQQNGRHERMHRTLKNEACKPPSANAAEQQLRFDAFRHEFNQERPHEALGQKPPAQFYTPSSRRFAQPTADPDYGNDECRRVRSSGEIKWQGGMMHLSEALEGELVGIHDCDNGDHLIRFAKVPLGLIEARTGKLVRFAAGRPPRNEAQSKL